MQVELFNPSLSVLPVSSVACINDALYHRAAYIIGGAILRDTEHSSARAWCFAHGLPFLERGEYVHIDATYFGIR